jgi:hypothetical protein
MISVDHDTYYAAHRFGFVSKAGGRLMRPKRVELAEGAQQVAGGESRATVKEFATLDGTVIARCVQATHSRECWLRADLAELASEALVREAADYRDVIASLAEFIRSTDAQGAARNNTTVEQYRAKRHAAGARWDNYRARQRAGGF